MDPKFLIIETSGQAGAVALAEGAALLHVRPLDELRRQARDLAPAVSDLLTAAGWKPRDIQAVLVSRGPGSYTGLRVGIMSAKAFAYATGCSILGVDTFAAIALQTSGDALALDVLTDAQQDKVYVQRYLCSSGAMPKAATPLTIQAWSDFLATRDPAAWMSGPGLSRFVKRLPEGALVVPEEDWNPRPESVLRLGVARYLAGERDDMYALEPLYLRPSSAEEKWATRTE